MKTKAARQENTPHDKPLRREDLVFEELDGEAVLYDPRGGSVHRFDALTLLVWKACDGAHRAADITQAVTAAYDVGTDEALACTERLIAEFCTRDLLANGCATAAEVPAEHQERTTAGVVGDRSGATKASGRSDGLPASGRGRSSPGRLLSRRAVLRGGATKLAFAAPVISTFFARRACASGIPIHPVLSAFGAGGCKNIGYSCTLDPDCCGNGLEKTKCESNVCCLKSGRTTCYRDEDCCDYPTDTCNAGKCN